MEISDQSSPGWITRALPFDNDAPELIVFEFQRPVESPGAIRLPLQGSFRPRLVSILARPIGRALPRLVG